MLPNEALTNFVFPNNAHITWSLMIVIYPYITGLVAGAFIVSSLYHVFKVQVFKPIARFALITAFCFGLFAGLPLLLHLGQPQRAFNIFITPHFSSAMSIFGYIYVGYMILLSVEIWLDYRQLFVQWAQETPGFKGWIWKALTLGVTTYTPQSARVDHKITTFLAALSIPWASILHGYVGFIFGTVKANVWWATPLQPIIFLLSAIVSGIAMLCLLYTFIRWRQNRFYDFPMIRQLMVFLWGFFIAAYIVEILEIVYVYYEHGGPWELIKPLLAGPLFGTYVLGQALLFSLVPFLILGYITITNFETIKGRTLLYLSNLACILLVLQVLFMRFNVVVGGQMISHSNRGFVPFHFEFFTAEGVAPVLLILAAPFITYYLISRIIPIFDEDDVEAS